MSNKRIYKTGTPIKNMFDGDQVLRIPVMVEEHSDGSMTYARFQAIIRSDLIYGNVYRENDVDKDG